MNARSPVLIRINMGIGFLGEESRKKLVGSGFHTRFPFVAFNAEGGDRAWNQV